MSDQAGSLSRLTRPNTAPHNTTSRFNPGLRTTVSALAVAAVVYGQTLPARAGDESRGRTWVSVEAQAFWLGGGEEQTWTEASRTRPPVIGTGAFAIKPDNGWVGRFGFGTPVMDGISIAAFARFGQTRDRDATASETSLFNVLGGNYPTYYTNGTVTHEEKHAVVDFEVRKDVGLGMGIDATVKGGVRYANFRASTDTELVYLPNPGNYTLLEHRKTKFHGLGPRLGMDVKVPLNNQWKLDVSGSGSVMWGKKSRETETIAGVNAVTNSLSTSDSDTVWNLEGNLGLSYVMDNIELSGGIRAEQWWGVHDQTRAFAFNGDFGDDNADRFIWGPYLRMTFKTD